MKKIALLVGVSEYEPGLNPLPGAIKDIEAMQRVLQHASMGGFDQVKSLSNPSVVTMQEEIETLFSDCSPEDVVLLFFSGHGIADDRGKLCFATRETRKNVRGDLLQATAVPAAFIQERMSQSNCKRQVVILDCCFSGAFANGMTAKDEKGTGEAIIDVQAQLGGEGRVVMTSSTATQPSFFDQQTSELSVYTRYLVEGIETGAADLDGDGQILAVELHDYAQKKVQASLPTMKPRMYPVGEGFRIILASAPACDAKVLYRREAEYLARQGAISGKGEFSYAARSLLNILRETLSMPAKEAEIIELEVLKPYREYRKKLQRYREIVQNLVQGRAEIDQSARSCLIRLQDVLSLKKDDADQIEAEMLQMHSTKRSEPLDRPEPPIASSTQSIAIAPQPSVWIPKKRRSAKPFSMIVASGFCGIMAATTSIYFRAHDQFSLPSEIDAELDYIQRQLDSSLSYLYSQLSHRITKEG